MKDSTKHIAQYHLHKAHPEMLQFEMYDLNAYRKRSVEKAAIPHSHSYYQVIWFFEDGGSHVVDFESYEIRKNMIFFIAKDRVHAFDDNLDIQGLLIHFNESFFMHNDVDIFLKYHIFNSQENPQYIIDDDTAETAHLHTKLISRELSNRTQFGYEDSIRFSLKALLINLERVHQKEQHRQLTFKNHYELQFAKYKELVEDNYAKGLSVADYAQLLYISSKTLNTITKEIAKKSASEIIANRIILQAKRLLKFTSLQIGEIAFKVGFDDPSYFVKYFKRHVGHAPTSYRNEVI
ncbi:AraC family transcriptional regulator [Kordia sp.]|uniref:helix-turn-helix domain-containing protein n=1 Tax=Kordia sp. TaxID=1965332 RepID=UPI0025C0BE43|nr:AraC family transcriptional regulator [Kordia sp.]MCH2196437.1 AraC family transcriptional regulator [Kordia sp.]